MFLKFTTFVRESLIEIMLYDSNKSDNSIYLICIDFSHSEREEKKNIYLKCELYTLHVQCLEWGVSVHSKQYDVWLSEHIFHISSQKIYNLFRALFVISFYATMTTNERTTTTTATENKWEEKNVNGKGLTVTDDNGSRTE